MVKAIHSHKNCTTPIHRIIIHIGRFQLNRVRGHSAGRYNQNVYIESRIRVVSLLHFQLHIYVLFYEKVNWYTQPLIYHSNILHTPRIHIHRHFGLAASFRITIVTIIFAHFQWLRLSCSPLLCRIEEMVLIAIYLPVIICFARTLARSFVCSFIRSVGRAFGHTSNGLTHQLKVNKDRCHKNDWAEKQNTLSMIWNPQHLCYKQFKSYIWCRWNNIAIGQ